MIGISVTVRDVKRFYLALIFLIAQLCTTVVCSAKPVINFNEVNVNSTNRYATVHDLYKSSNGTLWIAYRDSIVRQRGGNTEQYKLDIPKYALSFPVSINIVEYQSDIWLTYENSWFIFDSNNNVFKSLTFAEVDTSGVADIYIDAQDTFWLATFSAIYRKFADSSRFERLTLPEHFAPKYKDTTLQLFARKFMPDSTGQLWLGTQYLGLVKIPKTANDAFMRYDIASDTSVLLNANEISAIQPIGEYKLLLGTSKGLFVFNTLNQDYYPLNTEPQVDNITDIIQLQPEQLLINADGLLLSLSGLDEMTDRATQHTLLPQLNVGNIKLLRQDDESIVWLAIESGGLYKGSVYSSAVSTYLPAENGLRDAANFIAVVDNRVVFGGNKGSNLLNTGPLSNWPTYSFYQTPQQQYIGLQDKVIALPSNNTYKIEFAEGGAGKITSIALSNPFLVLVSLRFGLIIYNHEKDSLHDVVNAEQLSVDVREVIKVFASKIDNKVLLVFPQGLKILDVKSLELADVELPDDLVEHFTVYRATAFDGRIFLFDQKKNVRVFNAKGEFEGQMQLPLSDIGCMASLELNVWWLASAHGSVYRWRSDTGEVNKMTTHDGLSTGGVNGKGCLRFGDQLIFTGPQTINAVDKHSNTFNPYQPTITADLSFYKDKVKHLVSEINGYQLTLGANDFPLTIDLFSSSLVSEQENQLRARIPNLSEQWDIRSQSNNAFRFDSLPVGPLTIEVAASNNDGVWSETKFIDVNVLPPWYLSSLAIVCYTAGILSLFFLFYRYRLNRVTQQAKTLEKVVSQRTFELAQQKKNVETLLACKEQEFVHLSHELRTPLTLVLQPIKALVGAEKAPEKRSHLEVIQRNGQHLLRMVDQLLQLERSKMDQVEEPQVQDISQSLRLMVESFHLVAHKKNIQLVVEETVAVNGRFRSDALEKICLNLISNAIKYTPSGGSVNISAQLKDNGDLSIVVADNGLGIDQQKLPYIFNKYYRVADHRQQKESGAGVGLSLVKQLVEIHQGQVNVQSVYGKGSAFEVVFPSSMLTTEEPVSNGVNAELIEIEVDDLVLAEQPKADMSSVAVDLGKPVILVVEDNQDLSLYIKQALSGHYSVQLAVDGEQGLAKAIEIVPDLVVSDVMMPKMDGFELCAALKSNELVCHIPVLLLTARGDRESRIEGWKKAADEYLTKPFDEEELIIRISNLLSIRRLLRKRFGREVEDGKSVANADSQDELTSYDLAFIEKLDKTVQKNYQQVSFNTIEFASIMAMSERQLQRKMKALINVTPKEYIRVYRLNQAIKLLKDGMKVNLVADSCGFSSPSYFANCFKAKFDMTAKQFQLDKNKPNIAL